MITRNWTPPLAGIDYSRKTLGEFGAYERILDRGSVGKSSRVVSHYS